MISDLTVIRSVYLPANTRIGRLRALFATEIPLCREDGCVSEQELNLFYLSAGSMAQLCTGSAQIVAITDVR